MSNVDSVVIVISLIGYTLKGSRKKAGSDAEGSPPRHSRYSEELLVLGALTSSSLLPVPEVDELFK